MLLATWNVNSLKARLPRVLQFVGEHAPDVLCLQETKVEADAFPHAELADAGYRAIDHSAGRWAGVAILARDGIELHTPRAGLDGEAVPDEARWLEASAGALRLVSTYVPNGRAVGTESFAQKLTFYDAAARRVGELSRDPLVLMGDLNVCPADLDCYDPSVFTGGATHLTDEERAGFRAMLAAGLHDSFRELHPDDPGFTWWDYRAGHFHKRLGLRIDFALVSDHLARRVVRCGIDRNYRKGKPTPSDHAPLLLELRD